MLSALALVILSYVFTAVALCWTISRCISRFIVVRSPWIDDYLSIASMLCSITLTGLHHGQLHNGLGHSIFTVGRVTAMRFLAIWYTSILVYAAGMTTLKCSALFQYLRFIFPGRMRRFCWVMLVFNIVFGLLAILIEVFQCRPVSFAWNKAIAGGFCMDLTSFWYIAGSAHIVTDFVVLGIPICLFKSMKLPARERVALIASFMTAGMGGITAIIRMYGIWLIIHGRVDVTKNNPLVALLSTLELNLGIIGICTPPLKPLIVKLYPNLLQGQKSRHRIDSDETLYDQSGVLKSHSSQETSSVGTTVVLRKNSFAVNCKEGEFTHTAKEA